MEILLGREWKYFRVTTCDTDALDAEFLFETARKLLSRGNGQNGEGRRVVRASDYHWKYLMWP
jgi:hypothetical protein